MSHIRKPRTDTSLTLQGSDLPILHTLANTASQVAQHRYLFLLRYDLASLVLGTFASALHPTALATARVVNALAALLFFGGFGLTVVLLVKNYDRIWYGGRAAAESVKTLAWRYAVRAEPFHLGDQGEVDEQFASALRAVLKQREALNIVVESVPLEGKQISPSMRALRGAELGSRLEVYLRDRVEDQQRWYSNNSAVNARNERRLFGWVLAAQGTAGLFALTLIVLPEISVSLTGVFTTTAAGLLVWMQARQHQELAQAYAVAAQELSFALVQGAGINSESAFSQFVSDTESAISREHTLWAARRDRLPPSSRV